MQPHALPDRALDDVPAQRGPDAPVAPSAPPADQSPRTVSASAAPGTPTSAPTAPRSRRHAAEDAAALPQLGTGRVVAGALAGTAGVVAFDLWLTGRLSLFFDLCFVLVCLSAAMVVRRRGLFAVAVLAPLLLGGTVALLAVTAPAALTASDLPFVSTWLTGLAHHGAALAGSQVVALAVVGLRAAQSPPRRTPHLPRRTRVD